MSKVPYPVVRLANPAARKHLIKCLMGMGFVRSQTTVFERLTEGDFPDLECTYLTIERVDKTYIVGRRDDECSSEHRTLVNSPAHMLSYIRSKGIKP